MKLKKQVKKGQNMRNLKNGLHRDHPPLFAISKPAASLGR